MSCATWTSISTGFSCNLQVSVMKRMLVWWTGRRQVVDVTIIDQSCLSALSEQLVRLVLWQWWDFHVFFWRRSQFRAWLIVMLPRRWSKACNTIANAPTKWKRPFGSDSLCWDCFAWSDCWQWNDCIRVQAKSQTLFLPPLSLMLWWIWWLDIGWLSWWMMEVLLQWLDLLWRSFCSRFMLTMAWLLQETLHGSRKLWLHLLPSFGRQALLSMLRRPRWWYAIQTSSNTLLWCQVQAAHHWWRALTTTTKEDGC